MKMKSELTFYSIPERLNLIIIIICSFLYFYLLILASEQQHWHYILLIAIGFAVCMIPVYTLIHEAEHSILFNHPTMNDIMGRWLCCLFIVPFTFFKHCHFRHHKKNRTDIEMWELYFEHKDKWKKYGNLYAMMIGFGYWLIVLSVILFSFSPKLLYNRFFLQHTEIAGFLEGSRTKEKIHNSRFESLLVILFQIIIFLILPINFKGWIFCFLAHGFIWSSQNYVNHAFSPRDIINGAHNLKIPYWLSMVYLNFNLHLAHHQHPKIPWIHLPHFINNHSNRISFFRNYLRLWKGPVFTNEPAPIVTDDTM